MRFPSALCSCHAALVLASLLSAPALAAAPAKPTRAPAATPMPDEEPEFRFDFGLYGGAHFFHKEHALRRDLDKEDQPGLSPNTAGMFGARLGLHFNRWVGLEAEVGGIPTRTRDSATDMWVFAYRGSLVLNLSPRWEFQPFVEAGYGALHSLVKDEAVVPSGVYGFLHGGLGFKIGFTPWTGLRVDGRVLAPWTLLDPVIPAGERLPYKGPDWEVTGGLYINFGEIEKVHFYSTKEVVVKQQQRPPAPLGPRKRLDSDGDGIPDDADRCPDLAEDRDGYEDDDGCPDPDNDKDGVPDGLDKCPNDPEDRDGYEDHDGCPDADNDMDGIPDARDKCPDVAEDRDGFDDEDGCPDPDNDKDGVPDARDKCPNNAEKVNGYQDDDGCPDEIPAAVKKFTGVIEGINFKTGSADILPGSYVLLDRAVKVLQDYPDVALEISGHTDNRGKPDHNHDLSQRRADAVRMYFVSRGIAAERLQSIGYGQDRPIAGNRTAAGRARNRRTEFRLISPAGTPQ